MDKILNSLPATGLTSWVALERATTAPNPSGHGTALPVAGARVAATRAASAFAAAARAFGSRVIDLPAPSPRSAPV